MNVKIAPAVVGIFLLFLTNLLYSEDFIVIENELPDGNEGLFITIDPKIHLDYGFAYPLTYELAAAVKDSAEVFVKFSKTGSWRPLPEHTSDEFINGQEMTRFDYNNEKVYVSVAFSLESRSIYLRIVESDIILPIRFQKICKYYDDRQTAVTLSADDMAGWSRSKFEKALEITRSYNLWVTCAINTNGASSSTYDYIQAQLDSGYMEAGCHSRSHPPAAPYSDYESEITGNRDDLIKNLVLPDLFKLGSKEYIYSWIAPHGYIDAIIDSIVGREKFLVNRLYTNDYFGFPDWNDETGYYQPVGVARAFDPPRDRLGWGIGTDDIDDLNGAFDWAYENGEVYHAMCHPNVVEWDSSYTWDHLEHISNRNDVWYVSLGHLFLYHFAEENYAIVTSIAGNETKNPASFSLAQNYPNPFNPSTVISWQLAVGSQVELSIYNTLGEKVTTLVSEQQEAGHHQVEWDGSAFASGVYIYRLYASGQERVKKMILVR